MAALQPSDSFYLVHGETGQRYYVRGQIVIGRSHGEMVFTADAKLSSEHCRLTHAEGGVLVVDLGSANGTYIEGKKLLGDAPVKLVAGQNLRVGEQEFTLQILSIARLVKPRKSGRSKRKKSSGSFMSYVLLLALFAGAVYAFKFARQATKPVINSDLPRDTLRELAAVFTVYDQIQSSVTHESAPLYELTTRFEKEVVMPLQGLSLRLARSQMEKPRDQILVDVEKEYASSFSSAVHAYTIYLQTGDTQYLEQMDQANDQMDQMAGRFRELLPSAPLPIDLRSPQRLVEKEMRKAFKSYRATGESMAGERLNAIEARRVRDELLPQLQAVFTRMGGVAPESAFTRRRLELEQKLVSSVIGQLKAMLMYAETREAKYAADSEHWLALIQRNRDELKDLVARRPAATTSIGGGREPVPPPPPAK